MVGDSASPAPPGGQSFSVLETGYPPLDPPEKKRLYAPLRPRPLARVRAACLPTAPPVLSPSYSRSPGAPSALALAPPTCYGSAPPGRRNHLSALSSELGEFHPGGLRIPGQGPLPTYLLRSAPVVRNPPSNARNGRRRCPSSRVARPARRRLVRTGVGTAVVVRRRRWSRDSGRGV